MANVLDKLAQRKAGLLTPADERPAEPERAKGKYVPPNMREGNQDLGKTKDRDDQGSLRVSNISDDTTEDDMYALFSRIGPVQRMFLARVQPLSNFLGNSLCFLLTSPCLTLVLGASFSPYF